MAVRILICDDESALRDLVSASLADARFDVFEARDGDESLDLARRQHPDLILLDMMMPGRTGLEVLRELRSDSELASIPVVMLTARTQAADRAAAEAAGADRFVEKPFSPSVLVALVDELVGARS